MARSLETMINDDDGDGDGVKGPVRRKLSCRPVDSGNDLSLVGGVEGLSMALTHGIPSIVEEFSCRALKGYCVGVFSQ